MIASFEHIIKFNDDYQHFVNSLLSGANWASIGNGINISFLLNCVYIIAGSMRWITLQSKVHRTIGFQNNISNTFLSKKLKKKPPESWHRKKQQTNFSVCLNNFDWRSKQVINVHKQIYADGQIKAIHTD